MEEPCRSLDDVEYQTSNGIGNPLWHIEVLCAEIRTLQRQIAKMEKETGQRKLERLARNLLDPEMYGHAVTGEIRDDARDALGMKRSEVPNV